MVARQSPGSARDPAGVPVLDVIYLAVIQPRRSAAGDCEDVDPEDIPVDAVRVRFGARRARGPELRGV